jgi:hypothetical protein
MCIVQMGSAYCACQAGPARGSQPTWPFGPRPTSKAARSHGAGRQGPDQIWPNGGEVPVGEGSMTLLEPQGFDLGELDGGGSPCEVVNDGEI